MSDWSRLTPKQRSHLILACSQGLNPVDKALDQAAIKNLKAAGLIHKMPNKKGRVLWRPTDAGRELVASRGLIPTFLHRRGFPSYTCNPQNAMHGEPEVMPDAA